jgi:hypothetical protein
VSTRAVKRQGRAAREGWTFLAQHLQAHRWPEQSCPQGNEYSICHCRERKELTQRRSEPLPTLFFSRARWSESSGFSHPSLPCLVNFRPCHRIGRCNNSNNNTTTLQGREESQSHKLVPCFYMSQQPPSTSQDSARQTACSPSSCRSRNTCNTQALRVGTKCRRRRNHSRKPRRCLVAFWLSWLSPMRPQK